MLKSTRPKDHVIIVNKDRSDRRRTGESVRNNGNTMRDLKWHPYKMHVRKKKKEFS